MTITRVEIISLFDLWVDRETELELDLNTICLGEDILLYLDRKLKDSMRLWLELQGRNGIKFSATCHYRLCCHAMLAKDETCTLGPLCIPLFYQVYGPFRFFILKIQGRTDLDDS